MDPLCSKSEASYLISLIIPTYNEENVLPLFFEELFTVLAKMPQNIRFELICVDVKDVSVCCVSMFFMLSVVLMWCTIQRA